MRKQESDQDDGCEVDVGSAIYIKAYLSQRRLFKYPADRTPFGGSHSRAARKSRILEEKICSLRHETGAIVCLQLAVISAADGLYFRPREACMTGIHALSTHTHTILMG